MSIIDPHKPESDIVPRKKIYNSKNSASGSDHNGVDSVADSTILTNGSL